MLKKKLYMALFVFSLSAFLLHSYSYSWSDDYYSDDEPEYSSRSDGTTYYSMAEAYNEPGYYYYPDSEMYDDDYSYRHRHHHVYYSSYERKKSHYYGGSYASRLPSKISTSEKVIVIDPRVHAWGAYSADGNLLRSGLATAGARWCPDLHRPCKTRAGTFRIFSLGSFSCVSHKFPLGRGGAKMPYCMFFNGGQGLHGSYEVVEGNISHGCVRMHVSDAEWVRFNFAHIGTKVIVRPY